MAERGSEELNIRLAVGRRGDARSGTLGARLSKAIGGARHGAGVSFRGVGVGGARGGGGFSSDRRQRVVIKVSFSAHRAGSAKLAAHAAYLGRDGAARDDEQGQFYDAFRDKVEGLSRELDDWTQEDPRHFRIMIAPESASRMEDLQEYVRDVMGQMESDIGVGTEWLAINHWNTDNPHAHVILRGRTREGHELRIPRDYLSHGLRHQARERATAELGERSIFDERMALDRDIHAKGFSRLDKALAAELDGRGEVRLQDLGGRDPDQAIWGNALRARARELEARGLATEVRRNVMAFKDGWTETLAERSRVDITKTRNATKLHERGEEVVGEVVGFERRDSGNSVLILDTGSKTKTMVNTKSPLVDHLQKGSWVHVDETGHLSRLSYHPLKEQLGATAFTALDRELDRIGHGEERFFTGDARIDEALASRAQDHVRAGLGACNQDGVFLFHDGAKDALQGAEINALSDTLAEQGRGTLTAPGHTVYDGWRVGSFEELHAGRVALLERASGMGNHVVMVPTPIESAINIGDNVSLSSLGRGGAVQVVQDLSLGYGLGR